MVLERSKINKPPPLDPEVESVFVGGEEVVEEEVHFVETMTRDEKGTSYDSEELIKIMEPIFEDMNKNIMKGY